MIDAQIVSRARKRTRFGDRLDVAEVVPRQHAAPHRPTLAHMQAQASKRNSVQEAGRGWAVAQHLEETPNRFCSSRCRSSRRRGWRRAAWKQQALIQPADSEQHDAETD